jgi:solute:Na+ symporter, SSS family
MIWLLVVYAMAVVGVGMLRRSHPTGDQYLMGNRDASAFLVGSALFTLVGGGELVTLTALAFSYGFGALALFVGYAGGFILLAILAHRVRAHPDAKYFLSLPDYIYHRYGYVAGAIATLVSFFSFLALLVVQFIAAGELLAPLLGISYPVALAATAGIALAYLLIGGFETVLLTDVFQAASRLLLIPLLLAVGSQSANITNLFSSTEVIPTQLALSLTLTGIFAASSSADVWQRMYAARNIKAARIGLVGGALALVGFGALLVLVGLIARAASVTDDPNQAFRVVMTTMLPDWASIIAILLVLITVMSTADTEMFLTGGLVSREIMRFRGVRSVADIAKSVDVLQARIAVVACSVLAVLFALFVRNLVQVYTWLITALLIIAPTVVGSLLVNRDRLGGILSLVVSAVAFVVLAVTSQITPETAYIVLLPGFAAYALGLMIKRRT